MDISNVLIDLKNIFLRSFIIMLCLCNGSIAYSQPLDRDRWPYQEDKDQIFYFYYKSKAPNVMIKHNYFKDSVSVDEMVAAFQAHYKERLRISPYAGRDSVSAIWTSTILTDPLKYHPDKRLRNKRGVWFHTADLKLSHIVDENGSPLEKETALYKKKDDKEANDWLDFSVIMLQYPQHYMGFIVSPHPYLITYRDGKITGKETYYGPTDYFSLIGDCMILDGEWIDELEHGARQISKCLNEVALVDKLTDKECDFSVLLYDIGRGGYSLRLLLPEKPDEITSQCFDVMKGWVEKLQYNLFCPFYTTDFRTFTGRYLRVHCDSKGWKVEDYMKRWKR